MNAAGPVLGRATAAWRKLTPTRLPLRQTGSLELAHARIWARWGQRPGEPLWHRIESTRELPAVLELVRGSPMAGWIEDIGPRCDAHAIERALRRQWQGRAAELASWMPERWRGAIAWCARLVDLPLIQHLARGGAQPAFVAADVALREQVLQEPAPAAGRQAPADAPALHALIEASEAEPDAVLAHWLALWRRMLPPGPGGAAVEQTLRPLLEQHRAAFAAPHTRDGRAARQQLALRLTTLLRRALVEPVAAFVFLALTALEFERLRGELVIRAALPRGGAPA